MKVRYYVTLWCDVQKKNLLQPCCTLEQARRTWKGLPKTILKIVEAKP